MWVFGDIEQSQYAGVLAARIATQLKQCQAMSPGIGRHGALVSAFIECSALVQGAADAELGQAGVDEISEPQAAGNGLLLKLAQAIAATWDTGFAQVPDISSELALLAGAGEIRTKLAEGYAFYALYPESYLEAARRSVLGPDTCVIGIRSIGTGLAAMVAAGLRAGPAYTIRPVGHPFERRMEVGKKLAKQLLDSTGDYAIVDEGPGLSGSSFNGVADWLVAHGVAEERIHFFPSHDGALGERAQAAHRARWARTQKHMSGFIEGQRLEHWICEVVGPLITPLIDLSGGAWRSLVAEALPADPAMEKRKFLVHTAQGRWLAKFIGLGETGELKLQLAQALAEAGFAPEPGGICHGFMLMPWVERVPTPQSGPPRDHVLEYLAFRARLKPTGAGADLSQLFAMTAYNLGQYFGGNTEDAVKQVLGDASRFAPQPCCSDNRMHLWEWVHGSEGWLKLDALDHHAAHDLVGCQDIAWDLAGAAVELDLPSRELGEALYAQLDRPFDPKFIEAMELCYLGFQIGLWTMAKGRNGQAEQAAQERQLARYADRLQTRFNMRKTS